MRTAWLRARAQMVGAELTLVRPAPGSGAVAVRASTIMMLALLVLWALGHLDWAVYATFGAFASVYNGGIRAPGRWRLQAALGLFLTVAVICGVVIGFSHDRRWLAIPVCALWAMLAAALSDRFAWRPPGPMFAVFAVAVCASIPSTASDLAAAAAVCAATAGLAVGLGALDVWWVGRRSRLDVGNPGSDPVHHPVHRQVIQAIRCAVAVLAAGFIATASGIGHPYWAMVAAVVPLAAHTYLGQITRGLHRVLGTAIGLLLAAVVLQFRLPALVVILVVAGLQGAVELLVARNYGAAMIAVTPLALLLGQLADPHPVTRLLLDRSLETGIGVAVGLLIAVVTRERARP